MSAEAVVDAAEDLELDQQTTTETEETAETTETKPSALESAVAELARSNKEILTRVGTRDREEEPARLTPEQEEEFWAIYNPEKTDKEFMRKFFRLNPEATDDEVAAARQLFADVQKGLVRQSVKGAKNYVDYVVHRTREEFAPIREFVEEVRAERTRGRFFTKYDSLNDAKYEKIIAATAQSLANKTFEDEDAYFKALAEGAAETIKGVIPEFDLGKRKETAGKAPKLPRTNVGGSGGTGKGRSEVAHTEDQAASVLDD